MCPEESRPSAARAAARRGANHSQGANPRQCDGEADEEREARPSLTCMRAVQITRFGGPEVLDVVDLPDPTPGKGEQLFDISSSGVNFADTHHRLSSN
jgi:hypothetical protein